MTPNEIKIQLEEWMAIRNGIVASVQLKITNRLTDAQTKRNNQAKDGSQEGIIRESGYEDGFNDALYIVLGTTHNVDAIQLAESFIQHKTVCTESPNGENSE